MEIPSTAAGVVKELKVKLGDKVSEGHRCPRCSTRKDGRPRRSAGAAAGRARGGSRRSAAPRRRRHAARCGGPQTRRACPTSATSTSRGDRGAGQAGRHGRKEQSLITVETDKARWRSRRRRPAWSRSSRSRSATRSSKGTPIADARRRRAARRPPRSRSAAGRQRRRRRRRRAARRAGARRAPRAAAAGAARADASEREHAARVAPRCASSRASSASTSAQVKGSGPKGRITQEDVQAFVKGVMAAARSAGRRRQGGGGGGCRSTCCRGRRSTSPSSGRSRRKPLSRIKKITRRQPAPQLGDDPARHAVTTRPTSPSSRRSAAQIDKENEKSGVKLTMLAFLIKACVAALKKFPDFNASLDGGREPGPQAVLPHRLRGRHAERPGRAGDQGRRQEGCRADLAQEMAESREAGARRQAQPGRHAGRQLLDLEPRRHRRHLLHADHQRAGSRDPRRVASRRSKPVWDGKAVRAAPDAAAVAVVRPPRHRRRRGGALHHLPRAVLGDIRKLDPRRSAA